MNKILLVINVFLLCVLGFVVFRKLIAYGPSAPIVKNFNCNYDLNDFKFHYEKEPDNPTVLMLGNSLIEMANWNAIMHRNDIINRGISGDNISCICRRMVFLQNAPIKICFIEAGIDDLRNTSTDTVLTYYKNLIHLCQQQHKIPVINLVIYISSKALKKWGNSLDYKAINRNVSSFNTKLREYALLNGIDYIDMNTELSQNNILLEKFTIDGINLNELGYSMWAIKIANVLKNHGI